MLPFNTIRKTPLDQEILRAHATLASLESHTQDYQEQLKIVERLHALKAEYRHKPVSTDAILTVAGNLVLGLGVMLYENKHVWTSKIPLNFLGKK